MARRVKFPMSPLLKKFFKKIGRLGGQQTARTMTPEQRTARARKAAQARWGQKRKKA